MKAYLSRISTLIYNNKLSENACSHTSSDIIKKLAVLKDYKINKKAFYMQSKEKCGAMDSNQATKILAKASGKQNVKDDNQTMAKYHKNLKRPDEGQKKSTCVDGTQKTGQNKCEDQDVIFLYCRKAGQNKSNNI